MTIDPELLTGLGAAMAIFLTASGSAIASSHAAIFALRSSDYKDFVPLVQAGVLSVYGIIVGLLLCGKFNSEMTAVDGYRNLSAGLSVGLGCLASGMGMASFIKQLNQGGAIVTQDPPKEGTRQPLLQTESQEAKYSFKKLVFAMIFLESIGLYGWIVAIILLW